MPLDSPREDRTFDRVYVDEFAYVWSCLRTLGIRPQDLEDAVQDVFVVVHRRLAEFRGESRLRTWLFSIAVRVASRRRRDGFRAQRRVQAFAAEGAGFDPPMDVEEELAKRRATARLERFAATLDDDKRRVFELWVFEGRSPRDIADALDLPRNTVYSRLRVARQSFAQLCERHLARDERRMSVQHRRDRDEAQMRVRAAIGTLPIAGAPGAGWWARLGGVEGASVLGLVTAAVLVVGAGAREPGPGREPLGGKDEARTSVQRASVLEVVPREPSDPVEPTASIIPSAIPSTLASTPAPAEPAARVHATASPSSDVASASSRAVADEEPATASTTPSASLARAVAHIHAARDALAAGKLSAAGDALRRHAREFPQGPLEHEREAYVAMLACARGDVDLGRRFVAARPNTRLAQRVEAACAPRDRSTISTADGHEGSNEDPSMDSIDPVPRRRL